MDSSDIIRVMVIDDDSAERHRLEGLLSGFDGFTCVICCASGEEALECAPKLEPDVILLDIRMPGLSGVDCVRALRESTPRSLIMMLTVVQDYDIIYKSLASGALGFVLKSTDPDSLILAIRELIDGGAPMSGAIARKIVRRFQSDNEPDGGLIQLPVQQRRVLELLAEGYLYKEIADQMNIHLSTVRTHIQQIYKRLQVHSRTEAVVKYMQRSGR